MGRDICDACAKGMVSVPCMVGMRVAGSVSFILEVGFMVWRFLLPPMAGTVPCVHGTISLDNVGWMLREQSSLFC